MEKIEDGGPAFPCNITDAEEKDLNDCGFRTQFRGGMTLRDWFAGKALQGLLARGDSEYKVGSPGGIIAGIYIQDSAFRIADAMIAASKKK